MFAAILSAKQIRVLFCIFFAGLLAVGAVAVAQRPPNWDWCMGKNNPTFEQRVSACTAIIEWDGISPADKAKALGNRGVAYAANDNVAAAVRDYEESLRLDDTSITSHRFRRNNIGSRRILRVRLPNTMRRSGLTQRMPLLSQTVE